MHGLIMIHNYFIMCMHPWRFQQNFQMYRALLESFLKLMCISQLYSRMWGSLPLQLEELIYTSNKRWNDCVPLLLFVHTLNIYTTTKCMERKIRVQYTNMAPCAPGRCTLLLLNSDVECKLHYIHNSHLLTVQDHLVRWWFNGHHSQLISHA